MAPVRSCHTVPKCLSCFRFHDIARIDVRSCHSRNPLHASPRAYSPTRKQLDPRIWRDSLLAIRE
jgi:hypothetical protein